MNNIIVIVSIQRTASTEQGVLKTDKHTDTHTQTIWAMGLRNQGCTRMWRKQKK